METAGANPQRIAQQKDLILGKLPRSVRLTLQQQDAFILAVTQAVETYLALATTGKGRRREHRRTLEQQYPAGAHRPTDGLRQGLVGDLFDAYMSVRDDDPESRGFKLVADAVFQAAGVALSVTDNDRKILQARLQQFKELAAVDQNQNKKL